jgi:hypothetical protein
MSQFRPADQQQCGKYQPKVNFLAPESGASAKLFGAIIK